MIGSNLKFEITELQFINLKIYFTITIYAEIFLSVWYKVLRNFSKYQGISVVYLMRLLEGETCVDDFQFRKVTIHFHILYLAKSLILLRNNF